MSPLLCGLELARIRPMTGRVSRGRRSRAWLGLLAVLMSACGAGDRAPDPLGNELGTGSVGFELTLGNGVSVDSIKYDLTGPSAERIGSFPVDSRAATASLFLGSLTPGAYHVTLSADDGMGTSCSGASDFSVQSGKTSQVAVPMSCRGPENTGASAIHATINQCPVITSFVVAPTTVALGGRIAISASATDPDDAVLQYDWQFSAGSIEPGTKPSSFVVCEHAAASTPVTVTATDPHGCSTSASVDVTCSPGFCGDGFVDVDSGEHCDPPDHHLCDPQCQIYPLVCGDGAVQAGEDCDPPDGVTCNQDCKKIFCGNGLLEQGEQCDPPDGNTCDRNCQSVAVDDPCSKCLVDNCSLGLWWCGMTEPACGQVRACSLRNGCATNADPLGVSCYCGSLDQETCFDTTDASVPQGACRDVLAAAAGVTSPKEIAEPLSDRSTALGAGIFEAYCIQKECPMCIPLLE